MFPSDTAPGVRRSATGLAGSDGQHARRAATEPSSAQRAHRCPAATFPHERIVFSGRPNGELGTLHTGAFIGPAPSPQGWLRPWSWYRPLGAIRGPACRLPARRTESAPRCRPAPASTPRSRARRGTPRRPPTRGRADSLTAHIGASPAPGTPPVAEEARARGARVPPRKSATAPGQGRSPRPCGIKPPRTRPAPLGIVWPQPASQSPHPRSIAAGTRPARTVTFAECSITSNRP